jgi:transposase
VSSARRTPPRIRAEQSTTRNLLEHLRDRDHQVLLFARDLSVPFTNNQAERDVRPTNTQMKIGGCHRSETTAKAWLIRGYVSTAPKRPERPRSPPSGQSPATPGQPPATC